MVGAAAAGGGGGGVAGGLPWQCSAQMNHVGHAPTPNQGYITLSEELEFFGGVCCDDGQPSRMCAPANRPEPSFVCASPGSFSPGKDMSLTVLRQLGLTNLATSRKTTVKP